MKKIIISICLIQVCIHPASSQYCEFQTSSYDIQQLSNSDSRTTGGTSTIKYFDVNHHIFLNDQGDPGSSVWNTSIIIRLMEDVNALLYSAKIQLNSCFQIHHDTYYTTSVFIPEAIREGINVPETLNIYYASNQSGERCGGAAYLPWSTDSELGNLAGNITMDCPNNYVAMFTTLAHEIGHAFGLLHTHGGSNSLCTTKELVNGSNCSSTGDLICDTPADPNIDFNNSAGACYTNLNPQGCRDLNGHTYSPDPLNLMSYSFAHCRSQFSSEQENRMNFYASSNYMSPFFSSSTTLDSRSYISNSTVSDRNIEYSSLSISSNAHLTIDACNVTINYLDINSGSKITIQH